MKMNSGRKHNGFLEGEGHKIRDRNPGIERRSPTSQPKTISTTISIISTLF